ncbi:MAG: class I SAM-dependent methyltransferase [Planctomycetales bacterium]|nr:class I SAM-dependent methyltransferase [Planctomycetales bacterium]
MAATDYRHKEHPKRCAERDFWGQVSRTVHGKPVGEDQIEMIIDAIRAGLQLAPDDSLLDLGCGNGALASRLFDSLSGYLGVDFSPFLLGVARRHFAAAHVRYVCQEIVSFAATSRCDCNKALCYGVFSYLARPAAAELLALLYERFPRIQQVLLGNLPDRLKAGDFYAAGGSVAPPDWQRRLDDPQEPIGIWRTRDECDELARATGWDAEFRTMPAQFYAAHYRYDVLLTRRAG